MMQMLKHFGEKEYKTINYIHFFFSADVNLTSCFTIKKKITRMFYSSVNNIITLQEIWLRLRIIFAHI